MVNIIGNLFKCNKNKENELENIKDRITRLETRIDLIEQKLSNDINRLADKLDNKFDILNTKIDNLILLLKR